MCEPDFKRIKCALKHHFTHIDAAALGLRKRVHTCNHMHLYSLLLAACTTLLLSLTTHDLAQHHDTIPVHEGNAREAFTILESVTHQWLLRLEGALCHLVGLQ